MLLYHYTVGFKLKSIFQEQRLYGSPRQVKLGERQVVWLSANETYEQTARKSVMNQETGLSQLLSLTDTASFCGGVYRYVFDTEQPPFLDIKFIQWPALKTAARMRDKHVKPMLTRARGVKANPRDWYGVLGDLSIEGSVLQRLTSDGWVDVDSNEPLPEVPDNLRFDALSVTKQRVDDSSWR